VVAVGDVARARARQVTRSLREAGLSADASFQERSLGAQMRAAARTGARYALIVGEREVAANTVTWRRLSDGTQHEADIQAAVVAISTDRDELR
jgi:histidyl-tRNA synthetase